MADQELKLTVRVNAETNQIDILGAKMGGLANQTGKLSSEAAGLAKSFLPLASTGAIIAFFANAVKGAEEENAALRRLRGTLESTNQAWDKSAQAVESYSKAVQATTRFSDTQAIQALDKFTRVTGNLAQAQAAATLAMNLSVRSGNSLEETTRTVTDLLNGNERALMEVNREYKALAGGANTTQEALDNLARSTRNAAVEENNLTKSTLAMKNAWGELSDQIGNSLAPAVKFVIDLLKESVKVVETLGSAIAAQVKLAMDAFMGLGQVIEAALTGNLSKVKEAIGRTMSQLKTDVSIAADDVTRIWRESDQNIITGQARRLQSKKVLNDAEVAEEKRKLAAIEAAGKKATEQKIAREVKAIQTRSELEQEGLITMLDLNVQALATLNSLSEQGTKAEVNRAKAILALEKAIAIARAISEAQKGGPFAAAIAGAQIALISAQFAQQFGAIDRAAGAFQSGQSSVQVTTPLTGGRTITDNFGPGAPSSGEVFVGGRGAGGGGGGGSGSVVINVGGVVCNFDIAQLSVEKAEVVFRTIIEGVRRGTIESWQAALELKKAADRNSALAS